MANLSELISKLFKSNIELWHWEDEARVDDDHKIAEAKRHINRLNNERNDFIEAIDGWVIENLQRENK